MPRIDSEKPAGESDQHLIQTGYGPRADDLARMSTRLRVFVWIVVAIAVVIWLAAIWYVEFDRGALPFLPNKPG
jgi:hypothetical protein